MKCLAIYAISMLVQYLGVIGQVKCDGSLVEGSPTEGSGPIHAKCEIPFCGVCMVIDSACDGAR